MTSRNAPNTLTYADAGVDIDAGNELVRRIKPHVRATRRPGADGEIGGFGGLFDLKAAGFTDPVTLSSVPAAARSVPGRPGAGRGAAGADPTASRSSVRSRTKVSAAEPCRGRLRASPRAMAAPGVSAGPGVRTCRTTFGVLAATRNSSFCPALSGTSLRAVKVSVPMRRRV